jgi:glycosyltransferase involved in cell wall biosynthesis
LTEKVIRKKFGLKKDYLFYPTQVRPYKNVTVLIEALSILRDRNIDVNLVLTGNPSDVPDVELAIYKYKLNSEIICLSNVSENELYSLYRYAAAAPVPTLFEGGFPWQACEALFMNTPLILSDIPVVRERILFCGMSIENCGLKLINPHNPKECADAIEDIILNRDKTLLSQSNFKDKLLAYSWNEASDSYYHMFFTDQ